MLARHMLPTLRMCSASARSLANAPARRSISGVVFDMDGTLTREGALDYTAMYSRAGAPEGCKNILEWDLTSDDDFKKGFSETKALKQIETLDVAQQDKANLATPRIETLDAAQQDKANLAIREVEREGYARTQVNDKCIEMLQEPRVSALGLPNL
ncbi:hypothetical protein T484DRAFT_1779816 [Baffinella frigidus]|nr:hypothetical protein T484DRAFT_1779816 [Cryptophyta sp. CCMP2293]